eukprot:COSAG01_NODE_4991_length_4562_cov_3.923594_2_plen_147_part_00
MIERSSPRLSIGGSNRSNGQHCPLSAARCRGMPGQHLPFRHDGEHVWGIKWGAAEIRRLGSAGEASIPAGPGTHISSLSCTSRKWVQHSWACIWESSIGKGLPAFAAEHAVAGPHHANPDASPIRPVGRAHARSVPRTHACSRVAS